LARDEFTEATKRKLRDNVGSRCSNPDCHVPTMAPSNNIGVAAHICAASKGGPRYNQSIMSSLQRKSIDNGIWLCQNHATEIDRNPNKYPVKLLNAWKEKAEKSAEKELGKKLPSDMDAINMVSSALTGNRTQFLPNAIPNIHLAIEKSLEDIDSRFNFKTKYDEKMTTITCHAKENIPISMKIDEQYIEEYHIKFQELMEHGKDLKINSTAITIKGSQLFEEIISKDNTFSITTEKKPVIQKIWLTNIENNQIETLDDINGFISLGTKSFTFQGSTLNELFNFSYQYIFDKNIDNNKVTMSLSLDKWDGLNITTLPYFNKIFSFFSKLSQGWSMNTCLELKGENILNSGSIKINTSGYLKNIYSFLLYTKKCREVSNILHKKIIFTSDIGFTVEEYAYITKTLNILKGNEVLTIKDINSNPTITIIMGEDAHENIKLFNYNTKLGSLQIIHPSSERIKLFSQDIELPEKIINCDSYIAKIHTKIDKIKCGDSVKIELIPQDNFKYTEKYNLD